MTRISIKKAENGDLAVSFAYSPLLVEKIKSLPTRSRRWDKDEKVWLVDAGQLENLYSVFSGYPIDADMELIEQHAQKINLREATQQEVKALLDKVPETINGYTLFAHQREDIPKMLLAMKSILGHEQGLGKAQPLDAKVLTLAGWKKMGELAAGDSVINAEGRSSKITGVFPQGKKKTYRVTFNDGFSCECCDEHWWMVKHHAPRCKRKILTTAEIAENLKDAAGNPKWTIPIIKPIKEFSKNKLPLHPYVLGLLIGDGGFSNKSVMLNLSKEKNEVIRTVKKILGKNMVSGRGSGTDWGLIGISSILDQLGLQGKRPFEKFIPDVYKYSSYDDRLALLQGMMDTDGYYLDNSNKEKRGQLLEYSTSSPKLADDFCELIWSMGGTVRKRSKIPFYTTNGLRKEGKRCYSMAICLPNEIKPFRLSRKKNGYKGRFKYFPNRYVSSIEYVGMKEMQCISVDSPDNLYITDNYIVTHNTLTALVAAKLLQPRPFHVIAPVNVHSSWKVFADECGMKMDGLHSWAKIPAKIPPRTILVADECHKAQGLTTQRSKAFLNLAKQAEFVFMLSGTPMRNNRSLNLFTLLEACEHPVARNFYSFRERFCEKAEIKKRKTSAEMERDSKEGDDSLIKTISVYSGIQNETELRNRISDVLFVRKKSDCLDLPSKIYQWRKVENCLIGTEARELQELMDEFFGDEKVASGEEVNESYFEELRRKSKFMVIRRLTSLAKVQGTIEIVEDILDQGESVVICTSFVEPLEKIAEHFREHGVSVIHGGVKPDDRGRMVQDFQSGKNRVFVFTIGAGGEGITLHKAAYMVMHDLTWVPGEVDQAIDRCILEGTPILTPEGWRPIEEIKVNDEVISRTGKIVRVIDAWSKGCTKNVAEINVKGYGNISTTHDHLFLLHNGQWKEAGELKPGDRLAVPHGDSGTRKTIESVDFDKELRRSNEIIRTGKSGEVIKQSKGRINRAPDSIAINDESLFVFGYFIGDGWTKSSIGKAVKKEKGGSVVAFAGNSNKKKRCLDMCKTWLEQQGLKTNSYKRKGQDSAYVYSYSVEWANWFAKNFGIGAKNKQIPKWALQLNEHQSKMLLDGLMSSDGYFRNNTHEYVTISSKLAGQITLLIMRAGHKPTVREIKEGKNKGNFIITYTDGCNDGILVKEVKLRFLKKENGKREKVFDLSVEDESSFVTGIVPVHNCHRIGQSRTVFVTFVTTNKMDWVIAGVLKKKSKHIDRVIY